MVLGDTKTKEENMKKFVTLFLAFVLLTSMFVSCTTSGAGEATSSVDNLNSLPVENGSEENGEETEINEYELLGLPEDIDLGGKEISIYHWNPGCPEFEVDEELLNGDPVADAAYKKNLYTEQLLNVTLEFYDWEYLGNGLGAMIEACDNLKNTMSDTSISVDIIANYPRVVPTGAIRGLCYDLSTLDSLDISKEWWPQNLKNEIVIFDRVMFLSGDIAPSLIYNIYGTFYNKTLAESFGIGNVVEVVDKGEWTIDKMISMTRVGYEDLDVYSGKSKDDAFACTFEWWHSDALIQSCGFKILENTDEGIKVTEEFGSAVFGNLIDKLGKWSASNFVFNDEGYDGVAVNIFTSGRSIFYIGELNRGNHLQNTDIDYGIIPMPKLDTFQEEYITTVANGNSVYAVGRLSKNAEDAGAVLQTLGYYGLKYTTPAVFEITMQGKYSKDEDTMRLLNVIKNGVQFDLGLIYMRQVDSICDIPTLTILRNGQWSVVMTARRIMMLGVILDDLNEAIKENLGIA